MNNNAIVINTNIGCMNNCFYCPQKTVISNYKKISDKNMMSMDDFKKILCNIPKEYSLDFSALSEPFLNPDCVNMIKYAYDVGHNIFVNTTLCGLKKEDIMMLKNIGIEVFSIHLPNLKDCFYKDKKEYLSLLELVCENIKNLSFIYFNSLDEEIRQVVEFNGYNIFCGTLNSRCNLLFNDDKYIKGWGFCEMGYDVKQNVLPDGSVLLCCMDFKLGQVFGNLLKENYLDLKYKKVWVDFKKNQNKWDSDILCRECDFFVPYLHPRFVVYLFNKYCRKINKEFLYRFIEKINWLKTCFDRVFFKQSDRGMVQFMKDYFKNKSLVGVEIGVLNGYNALNFLSILNIQKLFLVDPFTFLSSFPYSQSDWDKIFFKTQKRLSFFKDKIIFLRYFSHQAVDIVPDGLDFVYIDGMHDYDSVKNDVDLYYPKVKAGGVFGGHDYSAEYPGLIRFVNDFVEKNGLVLYGKTFGNGDWWIIKK